MATGRHVAPATLRLRFLHQINKGVRKPAIWVGSILTAALTAAASAALVSIATPQAQEHARVPQAAGPTPALNKNHPANSGSGARPNGPLLREVSDAPIEMDGEEWSFPSGTSLSLSEIDSDDNQNYLYEKGGYPQAIDTQLIIQNTQSQVVQITDMRVVSVCRPPLTGALVYAPSQGDISSTQIGFNLDSLDTEARIGGLGVETSSQSYFAESTLSLGPGQRHTFNIVAFTYKHACKFRYRISALDAVGRHYSELMGDGGQPFRVGAPVVMLRAVHPFSAYSSLYVGGDYIPGWDKTGQIVAVNPRFYTLPGPP